MMSAIGLSFLLQSVVVFAEPDFPTPNVTGELPAVSGALVANNGEELSQLLGDADLLVWRHGSAFPSECWAPFVSFLESGGSLLHLGGEPFTRPVVGEPGARVMQPRTVSLLKELRLNQSYRVDASGSRIVYGPESNLEARTLSSASSAFVLEPRFSDTKDFEKEDGAPGARDAILRPLSFLHKPDEDVRFPFAASSYAIDRLIGRFAGGRWVFHLTDKRPTPAELGFLLKQAKLPANDMRVDPTFGCFHEGERPSVNVRMHRPLTEKVQEFQIDLSVTRPDGTKLRQQHTMKVGQHASELIPLDVGTAPGLYRVKVQNPSFTTHETGFWIMDRELFRSGDDLTMGAWALERNGVPEPVIGTTLMSGSVHRKFLFEPNAAEWDDSFAELASLDINMVRTGMWSAYKKISLDSNVVDEAFLRSLEAYYLSARSHGIPIIFTFFSFVPEAFGGISPYFDPRSIAGQSAYVSTITRRFANTKEMLWDLINEPSFANPDKLWTCRPNGDHFENSAFQNWLGKRFSGSKDGRSWQDIVRARWRLLPNEPIGIPTDDDFAERHVMENHRPYRAKEYAHFAQDAFRDWAIKMTRAIRDSGSTAVITVGQDEGGHFERPSPLYHHDVVDFTSIHTWWFNDALVWDGLMSKARGKPLLVSESGIMQRELLSGVAIRTPETAANLLARKITSAFASGAFGLIQWCYQVNPYMASDNEVGIGIKRVDGSYKPELAVLAEFARFFARNKGAFANYVEPDTVLVFPSSDHYSPRGFQVEATKRLLRKFTEQQIAVQVVPEHRTSSDLGSPRQIYLPSTRGISETAWQDILKAVENGAHLFTSGYFETDDAGLPAERLGVDWSPLAQIEFRSDTDDERNRLVRFAREVFESWGRAANEKDDVTNKPLAWGAGWISHNALPIDWTLEFAPWGPISREAQSSTPLTHRVLRFGPYVLHALINDSSKPLTSWAKLEAQSTRLVLSLTSSDKVIDSTR
ncbi:MAG: hypothetical protein ACI8TQ_003036 [Planctomycetota bacterium]|jgi:hypothetical protein